MALSTIASEAMRPGQETALTRGITVAGVLAVHGLRDTLSPADAEALIKSWDPKELESVIVEFLKDKARKEREGADSEARLTSARSAKKDEPLKETIIAEKRPDQFAEVQSSVSYPPEFAFRSITEQANYLQNIFPNLDCEWAIKKGGTWYNNLKVPDWVDGPLVYISPSASGDYNRTLALVFTRLGNNTVFQNYRNNQIKDPKHIKQTERTIEYEARLRKIQPGNVFVVPCNAGSLWAGHSAGFVREKIRQDQYLLGSVAASCLLINHLSRLSEPEFLQIIAAGDEFSTNGNGTFDGVPIFQNNGEETAFGAHGSDKAERRFGCLTAFMPVG